MSTLKIILAIVVALMVIIVAFVITRKAPSPPSPPSGKCATNSDCPTPKTCVNGKCIDTKLPIMITAAQLAAKQLNTLLTTIYNEFDGVYYQVGHNIREAAYAGPMPPLIPAPEGTLKIDVTNGTQNAANVMNYFSQNYYTNIMAITPQTPGAQILSTVAQVDGVIAQLVIAITSLSSVHSDLVGMINFANGNAPRGSWWRIALLSGAIDIATNVVKRMEIYPQQFSDLSTNVKQTAMILYNHVL